METWTIDEEAQRLAERFAGKNRAKFARDFGVPGGQVMVYQHITGRRPMSMEAAQAYARGFECALEEISPRLAQEAMRVVSGLTTANYDEAIERAMVSVEQHLQREDEEVLLSTYRSLPEDARRIALVQIKALADLISEKVNPVTAENDDTIDVERGSEYALASPPTTFDDALSKKKQQFGFKSDSQQAEKKGRKGTQSG